MLQSSGERIAAIWGIVAIAITAIVVNPLQPVMTMVAKRALSMPAVACETGGGGVNVATTDNLQTLINANPDGTVFCLQAGTHRPATNAGYTPKAGNVFQGVGANAIVSGGKTITGFTTSGSNYVADGFLPSAPTDNRGNCRAEYPLCEQSHDVYLNGVWLEKVGSQGALAAGKVYLDYPNNKIYIRDNPSGQTVEQAWATKLFSGSVTNVQIKNLTIQMTAGNAQTGAIGITGTGWIINNNEIKWNHGTGLLTTVGYTATGNKVHHNGQSGVGGNGIVVFDRNEVSHNNTAGYNDLWEAGNKFGNYEGTQHKLTATNNYFHDDFGPGIWCDINCGETLIANNYVAHEWGQGIFYEISCGPAIIRDNTVVGNYVAGISSSASKNVEVYNNKVYTDPDYVHPLKGTTIPDQRGIWHYQQDRPEFSTVCGTHDQTNINTHDNQVELNGPDSAYGGKNGLWTDTKRTDIYSSKGNSFSNNTYYDTDSSTGWEFQWNICGDWPCSVNFDGWQSAGQDTTGSTSNSNPTPPAAPTLVVGPQA